MLDSIPSPAVAAGILIGGLALAATALTTTAHAQPGPGDPALHPSYPFARDTDRDGIPDETELRTGTEPLDTDTDGDGVDDGVEDANRDGVRDPEERDPRVPGLHHAAARLPEPMVFDMVRALGARAGEVEVNMLVVGELLDSTLQVDWAPEVEWAIVDDFAIELELPMRDAHLHALKAAAQLTLPGTSDAFAHGVQVIGEVTVDAWRTEGTALYMAGLRADRVSLLAMVGVRGSAPATQLTDWEILVNPMIGVDLHEAATLALEGNLAFALDETVTARVIPQLHWQIVQRVRLQVGLGATFAEERWAPTAAARLVLE